MDDREKNNSGTMMGTPCGMVNGGIIRESLQYGWNGELKNMPIQKGFEFPGGMQIDVHVIEGEG